MAKKGTKKIYSQRRKHLQQTRSLARKQKEAERFVNANNRTHTVPSKPVSQLVETIMNVNNVEDANVNGNNTYPTEREILGVPRRGKTLRKNKKQFTSKNRLRLNQRQSRKQRERAIQAARELKEQERAFEDVNLEDLENNSENTRSMTTEEWYNQLAREAEAEEKEMERLEKEYEEREYQKAKAKYNKAEKQKFYFRLNDQNLKKINVLTSFFTYLPTFIRKIEFAYLDPDFNKSYYYIFKYYEEYNNDSNYDNYDRFDRERYMRRAPYQRLTYKVYSKSPIELFKPVFVPHSWNFYGPNDEEDFNVFNATYVKEIEKRRLKDALLKLPFVKQKLEKEKAAKATAPTKLKELQVKALESAIQKFEKPGRTVPQNVQNLIEQMIRPIDYRYYQGRDNLQRMKTNVFQTQANNGKERLRKINTGLFQE